MLKDGICTIISKSHLRTKTFSTGVPIKRIELITKNLVSISANTIHGVNGKFEVSIGKIDYQLARATQQQSIIYTV